MATIRAIATIFIFTSVAVGIDSAEKANDAAMTDEVSFTAVSAHMPNVPGSRPNQWPGAGKATTAARLNKNTTEME